MDPSNKRKKHTWHEQYWRDNPYNERIKLKSGTFLRSFCPHCETELTQENVIHLEVVVPDGSVGILSLNPYLDVFESSTEMKIPDGIEVKDLRCPSCHASLKIEGVHCGQGDAHVAGFLVVASNLKVMFMICMRAGCHWHAFAPDDEKRLLLDESNEW